jgi:transcriptional regulator with XRE-family HTH domain
MQAQLSRERIAIDIGKSYATVAAYELGRAFPPANVVGDLAQAVDCEINDLYIADEDLIPEPAA